MFYIFDNILPLPLLLILIGFTVIAGPFMEELAFRGMGYDAYRRTSRIAGAIVWTGLLFGAYHFRVDLILPLGLLGLVFGVARAAAGTLWCPILIHCFHNGLALWVMAKDLSQ